MKIESVALSLPSWKLSNEDVVDLIKFHSKSTFVGNLDKALRKISVVLKKTGAETRYWLNKQINEKPIDHVIKVAEEALKAANLGKNDIDLLVFVGIGKGFLEPAQSYFVAKALGMNNVKCFDVTDACMSWMTSMQIVDSLFKSGAYKRAMIVNAEFTVQAGALFKNFALKHESQLEYTFPTYTIGEGATCTILSPKNPENFEFHFSSRADLSDLCVIPLSNYEGYSQATEKLAKNGEMCFTSFGVDLHEKGQDSVLNLAKSSLDLIKKKLTLFLLTLLQSMSGSNMAMLLELATKFTTYTKKLAI